jgi:integrase
VDYYQPGNRRRTSFKLGSAKLLTVAQAREAAREFLANVSLGEDPGEERRKARGETLEAFITDCYAPWVTENRKSGQATVNMILATFTPFLEKRITEITPFMMEQWKTRVRKERKLKASTVNRNVTALKAALNWGVKHGVIPENPIKGVEALQERDSVSKVRYLSPEEEKRLCEALDAREERVRQERARYNLWRQERRRDPLPDLRGLPFADYLKPMVILSLNTGIRRGSLFSLEWPDVDFKNEVLTLRATATKSGKTYHVPLNRSALEALKKWKSQSREDRLVFVSPKNKGRFDNCNTSWEEVLRMAEIEDFRWHDMRHSFASNLVMAGVDLNTVRELMGHADLKMTLRYAYLAPKVKKHAVSLLEKRMPVIVSSQHP